MAMTEELVRLGKALADRQLVAGAAGNISIRDETGTIYITARGARLDAIAAEDIACICTDGSTTGRKAPTSEHLIHTSMYKAFPDIRVVAHTHSPYATAAAVLRQNIPPIVDEMTILLGGGLSVAAYGAPGSAELAQNAVEAMGDKRTVLLANHGAVIAAENVEEAVKLAELCEHVAQVFLAARAAGTVYAIPADAFEKQRGIYLKKTGRGGEKNDG